MLEATLNRGDQSEDELWLLQHRPVYTQGLAGKPENLLVTGSIPVVQTDRGGQVTYHGPGQLTGYLLVDLKRAGVGIRAFVSLIEASLINVLAHWQILAYSRPEAPGVYVNSSGSSYHQCKIAALGLRIKRGCSYHGFNMNVDMDMAPWDGINACGLNSGVTQMADILGDQAPSVEEVASRCAKVLGEQLAGGG